MNEHYDLEDLDWKKGDGLLPAIIQHAADGRVLMLGYMNEEALRATREIGKVTFYSRSKQRLWTKGESSGHHLELVEILADCDRDTLLILARPHGPTCHTGAETCFGDARIPSVGFLSQLSETVRDRAGTDPTDSYTASLLSKGVKRCAQKVGEEGVEVALAAAAGDRGELESEAADLLYHLLVCLEAGDSDLDSVVSVLLKRHKR